MLTPPTHPLQLGRKYKPREGREVSGWGVRRWVKIRLANDTLSTAYSNPLSHNMRILLDGRIVRSRLAKKPKALRCTALHYIALHYSALHCTALRDSVQISNILGKVMVLVLLQVAALVRVVLRTRGSRM